MAGWGLGSWGLSSWGFGLGPPLYIVSAFALTERTLRVTTSVPPHRDSPIIPGDAFNPRTWVLTREDTGTSLLVISVEAGPTLETYDLYSLDKFTNYLTFLRIAAPSLIEPDGTPITAPSFATFAGCAFQPVERSPRGLVDLQNIPASPSELSGTLIMGSDGDYAVEGGLAFIRKLIYRRLITAPGEFFWLPDSYGIGLRIKEPLKQRDLVKLRAAIENQLLHEPEIAQVAAKLRLTGDGILYVEIAAILQKTNEQVVVPFAIPTHLVTL